MVKGTTFDTKWPGDHLWQPYINQGTILGSTSVAISRSVTVRFDYVEASHQLCRLRHSTFNLYKNLKRK